MSLGVRQIQHTQPARCPTHNPPRSVSFLVEGSDSTCIPCRSSEDRSSEQDAIVYGAEQHPPLHTRIIIIQLYEMHYPVWRCCGCLAGCKLHKISSNLEAWFYSISYFAQRKSGDVVSLEMSGEWIARGRADDKHEGLWMLGKHPAVRLGSTVPSETDTSGI